MANRVQHRGRTLRTCVQTASAAIALAVVFVLGIVATQSAHAQTFTVLYNFTGSDGAYPYASVTRDAKGIFYGTTFRGGSSNLGTAWQLSGTTETVLHSFSGSDGQYSYVTVVRDKKGNLYGTADEGGSSNYRTVWQISSGGTFTTLHTFSGSDGRYPYEGLTRDKSANLYGTTSYGGSSDSGTVWQISSGGTFKTLYTFSGSDGQYPYGVLVLDKSGNLYSTTAYGGSSGQGTVFELSSSGTLTTLHTFTGGSSDGCYPYGTLARDKAGNFYGTTSSCGNSGYGTAFKVDAKGNETVLYSFSGSGDGEYPYAGLIRDKSGNLYGTAWKAGAYGYGTAWKLSSSSKFTVLHSFNGSSDGGYIFGGLLRNKAGRLYGTASQGGTSGDGTVFKLTP